MVFCTELFELIARSDKEKKEESKMNRKSTINLNLDADYVSISFL